MRRPPLFEWRLALAALGGWPRRALAVGCLLAAAIAALHRPPPAGDVSGAAHPGVAVLVAAADLAAGATVTATGVRVVAIPPELLPTGAVRSAAGAVGRVVAGPMRRGEPFTDARLLGRGLAAGLSPPESVAVPVRLADAQTAALVRPGDRVDLLATPMDAAGGGAASGPPGGPPVAGDGWPAGATLLAAGVRVLAVLADPHAAATDGVLVVVAAADRVARQLAGAAAQLRLSVAIRPP